MTLRTYMLSIFILAIFLFLYSFYFSPPQIKKKKWYYGWLIIIGIVILYELIINFVVFSSGLSTILGAFYLYIFIFCTFYSIIHFIGWFFNGNIREKIQIYAVKIAFIVVILSMVGNLIYSNKITIKNYILKYENLPNSFDGFTIAHISDLHLGSFVSDNKLKKTTSKINNLNPDAIIFTGDLVNSSTKEIKPIHKECLKNMKAPIKLAILGNHDYHDFHKFSHYWGKDKLQPNMKLADSISSILKECGFTVLRDSLYFVAKNHDTIVFIGLNNYGKPPFTVYGNIYKVIDQIPNNLFSIVLIHDPFYWSEGLFDDIPLTLSGHTHGGQFGFFINSKLRLSFASINGKSGGLYKNDKNNKIIINAGLGHVAINFRFGFSSQICHIKLQKGRNID